MGMSNIADKVRKRETPFYDALFRIAKRARAFEMPRIPGLHRVLYCERNVRIDIWRTLWRTLYYQPLFRSRCSTCGKRLHLYHNGQGMPCVEGNLSIHLGDDVKLCDRITLAALAVTENPVLRIGDHTDISQPIAILVGREIVIGSHCLIGCSLISDNPGHNLDVRKRWERLEADKIERVVIGDYVWAALQSIVVGKVTVGFGAVIAARAVVTRDVPPLCVVAGNPARIVKKLDCPDEFAGMIAPDQYQRYLEARIGD